MEEESKWKSLLMSPYWTIVIIVLVAVTFFSLGRVSRTQEAKEPVRVLSSTTQAAAPIMATASEEVVASKSGTKYHYPWCSGARSISAKNLIKFNSPEEARKAGYTPASNCKGLK
jgi:hypothetical protein